MRYDERGNAAEVAYFGVDGRPMLIKDGIARLTTSYDERGNVVEEAYFGVDGKPALRKDGIARVTERFDDRGNVVEQAYFRARRQADAQQKRICACDRALR